MNKERSISTAHFYRKWEKVIEPLVKYERQTSDLGYPLNFFYHLEQIIAGGHTLCLNIATTLTGAKDNCVRTVFQGSEQVGKITFSPAILKSYFDLEIQKQMQERLAKFCDRDLQFGTFYKGLKNSNTSDQMLPWAVIKEKQSKGECRALLLSRDQYKKIVNLEGHQVAQCFIWGNGKQSSIIRFFYFPNKQNSVAYKIDNLQGFIKRRYGKSQFKVREQSDNSLTFVKIMYTNKSFYQQTLSLVQFLQKYQKIKISKIVIDWILDPHNRYYLIDLKEVSYTKAEVVPRIFRSLTDTLAYITCEVCQQKYREEEITKTLTYKLIWQFFQHLKKRQTQLSFTPPFKHSAEISRLCDLCYILVVSQSQLIELEQSIATVTHSVRSSAPPQSGLTLTGQKGNLYEWRLFFYVQDIRDLVIQSIDTKATYYVMIRIHNSITSFKLKNPGEKYQLIKGIKVHYLFSDTPKIDKFLSSSEIIIRITKGKNWNSVIAEGNTSGMYEESEKHSMRKFKQILVFNQRSKYSVVGIHIGIKMEGRYDPSHLALLKIHDVYMVEDKYSNCYALPAEWMETIDPSYCAMKSDTTTFSYSLHLSKAEKKALLPTLPRNTKKLIL